MSFNVLIALIGGLGMYMIFLGLYSYVTVSLREPPGGLLYGPRDEEVPAAEHWPQGNSGGDREAARTSYGDERRGS